jgi:hypothetical protein
MNAKVIFRSSEAGAELIEASSARFAYSASPAPSPKMKIRFSRNVRPPGEFTGLATLPFILRDDPFSIARSPASLG